MVWHNVDVERIATCMEDNNPDLWVVPVWNGENEPVIYATSRLMLHVAGDDQSGQQWHRPLPSVAELIQCPLPCLADMFCAESSCVHGMLRVPVLSKAMLDEMQEWGRRVLPTVYHDRARYFPARACPRTVSGASQTPLHRDAGGRVVLATSGAGVCDGGW